MLETCAEPLTVSGLDIVHRPPGNTEWVSMISSKVLTPHDYKKITIFNMNNINCYYNNNFNR